MQIVHELNQLNYGGAERIVRNIIRFDKENTHTVVTYKDGAFKKELEAVGATILLPPEDDGEIDVTADIIHVHTGGSKSHLGMSLGNRFPVIETIHSPVRSPMPNNLIAQRIGVSNVVSKKNTNCKTILNGIDFEWLEGTNSKDITRSIVKTDLPIVGRLGRLGRDKGCEEWLLVCHELQQQGYEFIPLVVGSGDKEYESKLKLMAASLPVKDVVWLGHRDDVMNCMREMDVFFYPSIHEGFGLVFAEAMYSDCMVVTCETDVTKELFAGYAILTKQSIPALVEGVKKGLMTEYQDAYSGISKDWVYTEYNAERMSKEYQSLYKEIHERSN